MELIETPTFTKQIADLLTDDDYRQFQSRLAANPEIGVRIKGSSGIRKIRVGLLGRGKRGGARVIYFWAVQRNLILLLFAYPKNVTTDLSPKQVAQLAKTVKEEFGNET